MRLLANPGYGYPPLPGDANYLEEMLMAKMTEAQDKRLDRKAGIKEGSARDNALDRKRGLPTDTKKKGKGKANPFAKR